MSELMNVGQSPDKEHDGNSDVDPCEVDEVGDEPAGGRVGRPGVIFG